MVRIVVNSDFAAQVAELKEAADVYDESGQLLGRYEPIRSPIEVVPPGDPLYQTEVPPYTEEELDRFEQAPGGRTLPEIWKRLKGQ